MTKVDARTIVLATLANPNRASLAPVMHNAAFRHAGLNHVYVAFEPTDIAAALAGARALGLHGVSISKPFKEQAVEFVDELVQPARDIGAINTILNADGRLRGYNFDGDGALRAVVERIDVSGKRVVILGAGGAARAIAHAFRQRAGEVLVYNRTPERARALAAAIGVTAAGDLADAAGSEPDVLINATSVGFQGPLDVPVHEMVFTTHPVVLDAVVSPHRTAFLRRAADKGCPVVAGERMLVYQGALQFELFTGLPAPVEVMMAAVAHGLARQASAG